MPQDQPPTLGAIGHASTWLNGKVAASDLRGKVVLLDFYTFECLNCKHTQPNLRSLYRTKDHQDFAIVSVHSPESAYERDRGNLEASLKDEGVLWPVAVDNDFGLWNAYGVQAWPTQMIFDRHGKLRATIVGEGQDGTVDRTVAKLIAQH